MFRRSRLIFDNWSIIVLIVLSFVGIVLNTFSVISQSIIITSIFVLICTFSINQVIFNESLRKSINRITLEVGNIKKIDINEFYLIMRYKVSQARKCIDLTLNQSRNPEKSGPKERIAYFNTVNSIIKEGKVRVRRIVTINSKEKLELVKDWLKKYKNCSNFHLRYSPLKGNELQGAISVQIIDSEAIVLAGVSKGLHQESCGNIDLFAEHKCIGEVFQAYYDELWNSLKPLKDGDFINENLLIEIENRLL